MRQIEISSSLIISALAESKTIEQAANLVGCSAPAIQARAKKEVEINRAIHEQTVAREMAIALAIKQADGVLTEVAKIVGLDSAAAVRYHIIRSPRLREAFEEARYKVVDSAEMNLFQSVYKGNLDSSWKILKTLGKDRGYTERREVDSVVTHEVSRTSSANLVDLLDSLAQKDPELVEAEFEVLAPEDRAYLHRALQAHSKVAAE